MTERRLNEFQTSLIELAGAVRSAQGQRRVGAEDFRIPEFTPDPTCHEAAEAGVLRLGSAADQAVERVVAEFNREGPGPDPASAEFGGAGR